MKAMIKFNSLVIIFTILFGVVSPRKDYKLEVERGEFVYINDSLIKGNAYFFIFNRTTKALNASFSFPRMFPAKVILEKNIFR